MGVLVEAISVIIRADRLLDCVPGGWESFKRQVRNETLCADGELVRVGFMSPADAEAYVGELERWGLRYLADGKATDVVVADQQRGLMAICDWAECRKVNWEGDPKKRVTVASLIGGTCKQILTPDGWTFEGSLSATFGFIPLGSEHTVDLVSDEDGLVTLRSPLSERPLYIGRTHSETTPKVKWGWMSKILGKA